MKEFNYLKERNRMTKNCTILCEDCPLSKENNIKGIYCGDFEIKYPQKATDIVRYWANKQPQATNLDKLKEIFPNSAHDNNVNLCPLTVNQDYNCKRGIKCKDCSYDFWTAPYDIDRVKPTFKIRGYLGKYVMHCDTEEKAIIFTRYLDRSGRKWISGLDYRSSTCWEVYKENSCYYFNEGGYGTIHGKGLDGYTILEFDDFTWEY